MGAAITVAVVLWHIEQFVAVPQPVDPRRDSYSSSISCASMSFDKNDIRLAHGASIGNYDMVQDAVGAGANVNGSPELPVPPIVAAVLADRANIINVLLDQGADVEKPVVVEEVAYPNHDIICTIIPGERVLHVAARNGKVEIVRLLLKRSCANVNATDSKGYTPLMATCICQHIFVEVVRLTLEAGADPALAEEVASMPLHVVAYCNHMDLVDMVYAGAPGMLNSCTILGETPLYIACRKGLEDMASKLLSLGARQPMRPNESDKCLLGAAVFGGFLEVMRILIDEGGVMALGERLTVLPRTLCCSVVSGQVRILQLLLTWGEKEARFEGRPWWDYFAFEGKHVALGTALPPR